MDTGRCRAKVNTYRPFAKKKEKTKDTCMKYNRIINA